MLAESMATSVVVGKIRGGRIRNIEKVTLKAWYLFIISFILEFACVFLCSRDFGDITDLLNRYFIYIHGFSYFIMFIGLILNFSKKSMILIFIGTLLNFIVIMANGGHMPVSAEGLNNLGLITQLEALKQQSVITHTLITESTKLTVLGDVIPIPRPYPLPKMISLGDIFIALGVFSFIQGAMVEKSMFNRNINMVKFPYRSK